MPVEIGQIEGLRDTAVSRLRFRHAQIETSSQETEQYQSYVRTITLTGDLQYGPSRVRVKQVSPLFRTEEPQGVVEITITPADQTIFPYHLYLPVTGNITPVHVDQFVGQTPEHVGNLRRLINIGEAITA